MAYVIPRATEYTSAVFCSPNPDQIRLQFSHIWWKWGQTLIISFVFVLVMQTKEAPAPQLDHTAIDFPSLHGLLQISIHILYSAEHVMQGILESSLLTMYSRLTSLLTWSRRALPCSIPVQWLSQGRWLHISAGVSLRRTAGGSYTLLLRSAEVCSAVCSAAGWPTWGKHREKMLGIIKRKRVQTSSNQMVAAANCLALSGFKF